MNDFSQNIKHLQKLSCIALSPEEEKKFWTQLNDIIGFLGKLSDIRLIIDNWQLKNTKKKLTLRTIKWVKENIDSEKILNNVKHPIVNNSIVIKSVLN